jgi:hypothetical protein
MGFQFAEKMSGTVEWDADPGKQHPFRFEVKAQADSVRDHMATGKAKLVGKVFAPPKADGAPAEGTIVIRPIGQRIIRYELAFTGSDGKRYEIVGQKDISWLRPLSTFTQLPCEILDEEHRRVGTCLTSFDLRRDFLKFLGSFRPA